MTKKKKNNSLERRLIKQFRNNPNKEYNYKQIAAIFEITDTKKRNEIIIILNRLILNKILSSPSKGKYKLQTSGDQYYQGILDVTSTGRGFVVCEKLDHDIVIPKNNLNKAFNFLIKLYKVLTIMLS